jgi:hypothetical protein
MACFEGNRQFLNEVAAALLPIASQMKRAAMVVRSTPGASEVQQSFALAHERLADQILGEQGIYLHGVSTGAATTATGGSTGMKYFVQQLLMSPDWTLTPDAWAADETAARATIQAGMTALLTALTAIPEQEE